MGNMDDLWTPYTKYVYNFTNFYRVNNMDSGVVTLPSAAINNRNNNLNNNFDGILVADSCSFDSYSQESEMETYSDEVLSCDSDDEVLQADDCLDLGQPDSALQQSQSTSRPDRNSKWHCDTAMVHQENTREDGIIPIITDEDKITISENPEGEERERSTGSVGRGFDFDFKNKEKAKPKLPGAGLLQDGTTTSDLSWVNSDWKHVVVHKCSKSCACMSANANMYSQEGYNTQNSF